MGRTIEFNSRRNQAADERFGTGSTYAWLAHVELELDCVQYRRLTFYGVFWKNDWYYLSNVEVCQDSASL